MVLFNAWCSSDCSNMVVVSPKVLPSVYLFNSFIQPCVLINSWWWLPNSFTFDQIPFQSAFSVSLELVCGALRKIVIWRSTVVWMLWKQQRLGWTFHFCFSYGLCLCFQAQAEMEDEEDMEGVEINKKEAFAQLAKTLNKLMSKLEHTEKGWFVLMETWQKKRNWSRFFCGMILPCLKSLDKQRQFVLDNNPQQSSFWEFSYVSFTQRETRAAQRRFPRLLLVRSTVVTQDENLGCERVCVLGQCTWLRVVSVWADWPHQKLPSKVFPLWNWKTDTLSFPSSALALVAPRKREVAIVECPVTPVAFAEIEDIDSRIEHAEQMQEQLQKEMLDDELENEVDDDDLFIISKNGRKISFTACTKRLRFWTDKSARSLWLAFCRLNGQFTSLFSIDFVFLNHKWPMTEFLLVVFCHFVTFSQNLTHIFFLWSMRLKLRTRTNDKGFQGL